MSKQLPLDIKHEPKRSKDMARLFRLRAEIVFGLLDGFTGKGIYRLRAELMMRGLNVGEPYIRELLAFLGKRVVQDSPTEGYRRGMR